MIRGVKRKKKKQLFELGKYKLHQLVLIELWRGANLLFFGKRG